MMSFYAGQTAMLGVPKYGKYENEYLNIIGGVGGSNRDISYFDANKIQTKMNLQRLYKDWTIIVEYFVFLLNISSIMKIVNELKPQDEQLLIYLLMIVNDHLIHVF